MIKHDLTSDIESKTIVWLKFICAIMVVLIHIPDNQLISDSVPHSTSFLFIQRIVSHSICEVAVPLFYIISSYLFFSTLSEWKWSTYYDKIKKRVRTLLIPYILWNTICIVCISAIYVTRHLLLGETLSPMINFFSIRGWGLMYWNCARYASSTWHGLWGTFILATPYDYPLWFVRDLFILCLCSPMFHYLIRLLKSFGAILLAVLFILGIGGQIEGFSIEGIFFFYLGGYIRIYYKSMSLFFHRYSKIIIVCSIIFLLFISYLPEEVNIRTFLVRAFKVFGPGCLFLFMSHLVKLTNRSLPSVLAGSIFCIYAGHCFGFRPYFNVSIQRIIPISQPEWYYFILPVIIISLLVLIYYAMNMLFPNITSLCSGGRNK